MEVIIEKLIYERAPWISSQNRPIKAINPLINKILTYEKTLTISNNLELSIHGHKTAKRQQNDNKKRHHVTRPAYHARIVYRLHCVYAPCRQNFHNFRSSCKHCCVCVRAPGAVVFLSWAFASINYVH